MANTVTINEDSNLVKHARHELELLGEEKSTVDGYLQMITIFSEMGHSGGSASVFIPTLNQLLNFRNLKPLTKNPEEWMEVTDNLWQNRRNPAAFSEDGGKTYRLTYEPTVDGQKETHTAEDWTKN